MSRNTSLLLDLDLARVLLLDEGNVRIVLHLLFSSSISSTVGGCGGGGSAAAPLAWCRCVSFLLESWLGTGSGPEPGTLWVCLVL